MARLVLLDRDGVINVDSPDYVKNVGEWQTLPGAIESIATLKKAGFLVAVCTNQSGIGRGRFTELDLEQIHARLYEELESGGARLDGLRYCPHSPEDNCQCRKPKPAMLLAFMREFSVDPRDTMFVGDAIRDIEAAHAAGCHAALVRTGHGASVEAIARGMGVRWIGDDLSAFAEWAIGTSSW